MIPMWKLSGRLGNSMFQYAYMYNQAKLGHIPDIYVQDELYFEESVEDIKKIFGTDIEPIDMVSIHVRRGDYVSNPFYVDLSDTNYYEKAMEFFPKYDFLVFSDNIEFCKKMFVGKQFTFCDQKDEIKAMNLMAGCKHNIIANSSFSWWAAFLNPNPYKVVIAPSPVNWYKDGVERTVCPSEWKKI